MTEDGWREPVVIHLDRKTNHKFEEKNWRKRI